MRNLAFAAALMLSTTAAQAASFTASDGWSAPGFNQETGAAFLTLTSDGACTITGADAPAIAGKAELHTHTSVDGVMQMRQVKTIAVAKGKPTVLAPGGLHVMLFNLKKPLRDGEHFDLTLHSTECGDAKTTVQISKARLLDAIKSRKDEPQHH